MTNREKLLSELAGMTNDQLEMVLFGVDNYSLQAHVDEMHCKDCRERFGRCPAPDDEPCATSTADWFSWECTRETLTGGVLK